ncbi:UDP-N-acetylmuramoyl-tripeptide--D-alanyl-D-alanine ligase [bacterium]|nr:UDP-N-acetylmuramoyl-tripeptide--D-alanyl-D-alanine ligase [bacterium]
MINNNFKPLPQWTLADAAAVMGADVKPGWEHLPFGAVSSDSRAIAPGQFFLALRGEKLDGHRFAAQAVGHGAAGLIVDRRFDPTEWELDDVPIVVVDDTLRALGDLAAEVRRRWGGPLLAISGSAGKTTTRRLVASALSRHMKVLEPIGNYNNLIGMPLTLLELNDHDVAVMELGMNQPGELRRLAEIAQPSAAVLTNIGTAHIGMFGSQEGLTSAKLDLFRGCAPGTPLAVNACCENTAGGLAEFNGRNSMIGFSAEDGIDPAAAAIRIENSALTEYGGTRFDLALPNQTMPGLEMRLFGAYLIENVAAAAALLQAGGFDPAWVGEALAEFKSEPLRGQIERVGDITFILDCYNASPAGMIGALGTLAEMPVHGRRVLVLADMLELGERSDEFHRVLFALIAQMPGAVLFALGSSMASVAESILSLNRPARAFDDRDELTESLSGELMPGDVVLFKGAHAFGLEKVAQRLMGK